MHYPAQRPRTVFVSHAHSDNDLCDRYVAALQSRGYDIWYDRSNMQGGRSLSAQIEQALSVRSAFLVFLTPASIGSYWVKLEMDAYRDFAAKDSSRLFLPVLAAPCEAPPLLRGLKWIDATTMPLTAAVDAIDYALRQAPQPLPAPRRVRAFPALRWGIGLGFLGGVIELAAIFFGQGSYYGDQIVLLF
jgi:hypothetical protein